jgi:hypothetical protein
VWAENNAKPLYATRTLPKKTSSGGPATLLSDEELKAFGDTYMSKLREKNIAEKVVIRLK